MQYKGKLRLVSTILTFFLNFSKHRLFKQLFIMIKLFYDRETFVYIFMLETILHII